MDKNLVVIEQAITETSNRILEVKKGLKELPILYVVVTNPDDAPSNSYINQKIKSGEQFGIEVRKVHFTPEEIIGGLQTLQLNPKNKVIIQLPLGKGYPPIEVLQRYIDPKQDVDGFSMTLMEISKMKSIKDFLNHPTFSPTAKGVLTLNKLVSPQIKGKNVAIVGKGLTSGLPIALMYSQLGATITQINSSTSVHAKFDGFMHADTIVSCAGVEVDWMNPKFYLGKLVINVGMRRVDGKLRGDIDYDSICERAHFINPVLGSTGKLTTLNLILNCVLSQKAIEQE